MQRTLIRGIFAIALVLTMSTAALGAFAQADAYLTANGAVYVRGGPGPGFWILGTLIRGESVPVLGLSPDNGWWQVRTTFGEGWVSTAEVTATNAAGAALSDPGPIGTVTAGAVHVRYGAGLNAASLGTLPAGAQVFIIARNADSSWYQVRWAYGTGWIAASALSISGGGSGGLATLDDAQAGVPLTAATPYVVVLSNYLNVRSGPGVNFAVLGQVSGGQNLPIVGRTADNTWYQVQTPFGTGWVSAAFVAARNEYGASPVTTATAATAALSGPVAVINTGALHLRSGPGAQYTSLGTLAGGAEARIVGRSLDWSWWLLETPFGLGWANAQYVVARGDISAVPYVPSGVAAPAMGNSQQEPKGAGLQAGGALQPVVAGPVAIVNTGALNIRTGPNGAFDSLGAVYAGARMPIVGQSVDRGWWKVESPYGPGWVSKLYVLVGGNVASVPVTP